MIKERLKAYLDNYFENYKKYMGTYPVVPYDTDEKSALWFGEVDEEEYIQWKYEEKKTPTNFSKLEEELGVILPNDIKEFYNSYYFLKLEGFYHRESVFFDSISENKDILQDVKACIFEKKGKKYIEMGFYGRMDLALCMEVDSGKMISIDYDNDNIEIITSSLGKMLHEMTPMRR